MGRVPAAVVLERAAELAAFTGEPGRITRPLATPALDGAMARIAEWMLAAGLDVRRDALGNVAGRREGGVGGCGTLVMGSHVDSVADAGAFDGVLGVLIALECVQALPLSFEVVAFADEDGLRFRSSYLGSRAYLGQLEDADWELRDEAGVTLRDAVGAPPGAPLVPDDLLAYFEVHIEQGPVLEDLDEPLGVVTAIAGQSVFQLEFEGRAGHAGTTPMDLRRDALAAAAELVLAAEEIAREEPGLVITVGRLDVPRGATNVIPGRVHASLDVRHAEDRPRERAVQALRMLSEAIRRRRGVRVHWTATGELPAIPLTLAEALAQTLPGAPRLPSGAGHDAAMLSRVTDAAMLFVRSPGGISHHPDETVREDDVAAAIEAARRFVRAVAEKASAAAAR